MRLTAPVQLADDETGNSFIPRLWARHHLDHLLEQGQTAAIQNDVIAMSEEFHIITPYTSLLVLETDADRQRFGVKRRFQMRDGESSSHKAETTRTTNWCSSKSSEPACGARVCGCKCSASWERMAATFRCGRWG